MKNRIWLEVIDAGDEKNKEPAAKFTKVLHKLGFHESTTGTWTGECYILVFIPGGEFIELSDIGY